MRLAILIVLFGLAGAAAAADGPADADFAFGPVYARNDSLEVLRPLRVVLSIGLVPDRLHLDLDVTAPLGMARRTSGDQGWKLVGDIVPATAAAFWILGCGAVADHGSTTFRIAAAPAAVLALAVMQPQLRWQPLPAVGLQAGWGSEWLLFQDEPGYAWRPGLGLAIRPVGTLVLEGGVQRCLWWSFEGRSGDWGWGWYAGVRVRPEFR